MQRALREPRCDLMSSVIKRVSNVAAEQDLYDDIALFPNNIVRELFVFAPLSRVLPGVAEQAPMELLDVVFGQRDLGM
jgi:hypothetical protein